MADNFNIKNYLKEHSLGVYSLQKIAGVTEEPKKKLVKEGQVDLRALVMKVNSAFKQGSALEVDGNPVTMWIASNGLLKTPNGRFNIRAIAAGENQLSIDGQPVDLPMWEPVAPQVPTKRAPFDTSAYGDPNSIYYRGGD